MSHKIFEAVVSRFAAQNLATTFPGGIWFKRAKGEVEYPYVVMIDLGNVPNIRTTQSELADRSIQFSIFMEEDGSTDPVSALGTLLKTFTDAMDHAPLTLPTSTGHVLDMRRGMDRFDDDPDEEKVWQAIVEYVCSWRRSVDYSPS